MRLFYAIPFFAVLCLATVPNPVYAEGNVLVPATPDTGTGAGSNDNSSSDGSSATDQSQSTPEESAPENSKPSAANSTPTPAGQNGAAPLPPSVKIPTQVSVIKPPPKTMMDSWGKKLHNALSVGYAQNPVIGPRDTGIIEGRLGISESKVKEICSLVLSGHVQSDTGIFIPPFNTFGPRLVIKYDGKPKAAWLTIMAACAKTPLPANSGTIMQVGDKYVIPISQVTCPAPGQAVTQLAINYAGDGKGQCAYQ